MREYRAVWYRGRWAAEWYEGGKRYRKSLGTTVRADVPNAVAKLQKSHEIQQRPKVINVDFAWNGYREYLGPRSAAVTMGFEWKAIGPFFGAMAADAIREEDCEAYIKHRREKGRSDGTIWTELGHLRSALRWADRKGLIGKAPAIKRPERPPPRDKRMTKAQASAYIAACDKPHVKLFVRIALATAARMGAILDLTWDRVDFDRRQIQLHNPKRDKTNKGRALVPMNNRLFKAMLEAFDGRTGPHVIEWGGVKVATVKKGLIGAGARSNLPWVTAHVFRHTAATWMAESGVSMDEIAQYLGHSDARITARIYARFSPDHLRKAADSLEFDDGDLNKE